MLTLSDGATSPRTVEPNAPIGHQSAWGEAVWVDLFDPTDQERAAAEKITGLRVPSRGEVSEIENSSRMFREGDAVYLSMPATSLNSQGQSHTTPVGFVLSDKCLLTLRFERLSAFEAFGETLDRRERIGSHEAFVGLAEVLVDRLADALERVANDLGCISKRTFRNDARHGRGKARRSDRELRTTLTLIGESGDALSNLRDSVLGIGRIASYVQQASDQWTQPELQTRLRTLREDITSLNAYDQQLDSRVNFLLDAALGFINIEQNNGVKVLTIASVVGIPPTFVVGLYGMNFKNMPEYDWSYGYQFGWAMILVSIVVPLIWFRRRGWL